MFGQVAEFPVKARIFAADAAERVVTEVLLTKAKPVRLQQNADAVRLPEQGFRSGHDRSPDGFSVRTGQRFISLPRLGVDHDLPARSAAGIRAVAHRACEGAEAIRRKVLHGFRMFLIICTQASMSSTGMYS